ncbi:hypothetical protein Tco_1291591 [Tanacetum coccineum]
MKLDGAQINQTTLRISQDWKHILGVKNWPVGLRLYGGAKKTENETEKGREQVLGIKRWSVGMRLREVQRIWKMKPRRVRDQVLGVISL